MAQVQAIPEGLHTLTPQLTIDGCDRAIDWYQRVFSAEVRSRAPDPSGKKVWHAELRIGNSVVFLNDTFPEMGGKPETASIWLYAEDIDTWWKRVVDAGAKVVMPLSDMFWGDRTGTVVDPFGNRWNLAQRMKNLSSAEMKQAQDAFVASQQK